MLPRYGVATTVPSLQALTGRRGARFLETADFVASISSMSCAAQSVRCVLELARRIESTTGCLKLSRI